MFGLIFFVIYSMIAYAFYKLVAKRLYEKDGKLSDYFFGALMSFIWPIWFVAVAIDMFNGKL